jgi:hypothetical protein
LNDEGERGRDIEVEVEVGMDATGKGRTEVSARSVGEDIDMVGIEECEGVDKKEKANRSDKKGKGKERDFQDTKDDFEKMRARLFALESEAKRKDAMHEVERREAITAAEVSIQRVRELEAEVGYKDGELKRLREGVERLGESVSRYEVMERKGKGKERAPAVDVNKREPEKGRLLAMARGGLREIDEMMKECGFCAM